MRILFTNISFGVRSGTELFIADLARQLASRGHTCALYSTLFGPAIKGSLHGILPLFDDLRKLPWQPDIIHGQHSLETLAAIGFFPGVPAIYVCHDSTIWFDSPPPPPLVQAHVTVDWHTRKRVMRETDLAEKDIAIINNTVDTSVFIPPSAPRPERPARALVFHSHSPDGWNYIEIIREVCNRLGIPLDVVGHQSGQSSETPQDLLPRYDLVFAKARCAIEAMACGCGVILAGAEGFGPLVTSTLFDELRKYNFGHSLLQHRTGWLEEQIARFDAGEVATVCQITRERCNTTVAAEQFERLYSSLIGRPFSREISSQAFLSYANGLFLHLKKPNLYQHSGFGLNDHLKESPGTPPEEPVKAASGGGRLAKGLADFSARVHISAMRRSIYPAPLPVIGGVPRSGTTLLRLMLDAHPDLAIPPETNWLVHFSQDTENRQCDARQFVHLLKNHPAIRSNWPDLHFEENDLLDFLPRRGSFSIADGIRLALLAYARRHGKKIFGEKSPSNTYCFSAIQSLLPEARFIHIVRDGRAVCASWRHTWFAPPGGLIGCMMAWQNWVIRGREEGKKCRHYLEIRFEDLVTDPEGTLKTVCAFLDLAWDARMLEYHVSAAQRLTEHEAHYDSEGRILATRNQRFANHSSAIRPPEPEKLDEWKTLLSEDEQKIVNELMGAMPG
ncbi:MAG: sulfotransferase [Methylacidiphilales bacterium]|nr:sulfotransferase [Candidatus Methylacidiphilales bacterium]